MQAMQAITELVQDDPYLRMTPEQRIAEHKRRRRNFFGSNRPTINPAPRAVVPPADPIDPAIRRWIDAKKETFSRPWYHVMWFFDLIVMAEPPVQMPKPRHPRIADIQKVVAAFYDVKVMDMLSVRRTADIVLPRQVAVYLCKELTLHSYPEIGRRFGGRDHTTQLYAFRKIEAMIASDTEFAADIAKLTEAIASQK